MIISPSIPQSLYFARLNITHNVQALHCPAGNNDFMYTQFKKA